MIALFVLLFSGGMVLALENATLQVSGSTDPKLEQTLRQSALLLTATTEDAPEAQDVVALAQAEYAQLLEVLYAFGFYAAVIEVRLDGQEAALMDPLNVPATIGEIDIRVATGEQFRFGRARIAPLAPNTALPAEFQRGETARADTVRDAAKKGIKTWRETGHAKAQIADSTLIADHPNRALDVDMIIDPGPKLSFGDVIVVGNSAVHRGRIRQIAGLPKGETYSPQAVEKALARLRKAGTFNSVEIREAETPNANGSLDTEIQVADRLPRRFGGGAEIATLDGVSLSAFWLHRNLFGGAERFRISAEVAQLGRSNLDEDYTLRFEVTKPAVYGPDTAFFMSAEVALEDEPDYYEEKGTVEIGFTQELSPKAIARLSLGYIRSRISELSAAEPNIELQVVDLTAGLIFDGRDDTLNPTEGLYLDLAATPFYETLTAQTGLRVFADARGYKQLGDDSPFVAAFRGQIGHVSGAGRLQTPPDFLFYSGGGGTVRGQPFRSLGFDGDGVRTGGQSYASVSAEIRYQMRERLSVVGFADTGFVGATAFENGQWHSGAGVGARYQTPLGPIRLDVATPISGEVGAGLQLYLGIGQAF